MLSGMTAIHPESRVYAPRYIGGPLHGSRVESGLSKERHTFYVQTVDDDLNVRHGGEAVYQYADFDVLGEKLIFWVHLPDYKDRQQIVREFILQGLGE